MIAHVFRGSKSITSPTRSVAPAFKPGTDGRSGTAIYSHFVLLLVVQTAYAWAYVHSPYLRRAVVVLTLFRLTTWTLPACLALLASGINPVDYLKLRKSARKGLVWGTAIGQVIVLGNLFGARILRGGWQMRLDFGWNLWVGPVLLVGLSEEVLFRGYFLRQLAERSAFWKANAIQAALFLGIHIPGWLLMGQFRFPGAVQQCAYVLGMALVLGYTLRKTDSLWAWMLIHSFSNFSSFAIRF
jgi:uncharacterized protein